MARRLEEGAMDATVNRELAALRRAFRLAIKAGKGAVHPDLTLLAENNLRRVFLSSNNSRTW